MEQIIKEFHQKMTDERLNGHHYHETVLVDYYKRFLGAMAKDYQVYRKIVPDILSSLENNNQHSVSYSLHIFFDLYNQLMTPTGFKPFDLSIADYPILDDNMQKMFSVIEGGLAENNHQRMSEDNFIITGLSADEKKGIASIIISGIQENAKKIDWNKDLVDAVMMQLPLLRQILNSLDNIELFYYALGLVVDRMNSSEYYQAGRDIVEETILSSYKDNVPELGYFNAFRNYSNIASIHASLLYANLSLTCALQNGPPYSERYIKEVIWQGIKFFRNVGLYQWGINIYENIPLELKYGDYERRAVDHTYFLLLLHVHEPKLPVLLLDYMTKEREGLISGGVNESTPWLTTLYSVRRLYPDADFSSTGLGFFVSIFEFIVPAENIKKYKDIIDGDTEDLKRYLKESLVRLNETRYATDFVYDNENAIKISSRLVEYSINKKDASAFLLSMMLKSDFSILFQNRDSGELAAMKIPEVNVDDLETLYDNTGAFLAAFPISSQVSANWVAFSEGKLFQLQLQGDTFSFFPVNSWIYNDFKHLVDSDYFADLSFSDTVKDRGGMVREVSPEEFLQEEIALIEKVGIVKLDISDAAKEVYFVKDMQLSRFPHNLFLNSKGELVAKIMPVTNVLSTEWLLKTVGAKLLSKDYTKSIWIPTEGGDMALNYLFGNIDETLQEHSFTVLNQVKLSEPLCSDINIICSHGEKNISEVQVVFPEENPTYNLDTVIGTGKILIFFVCYSGSMKTEFFRNNVTSLTKRFIAQGYEAVVAPVWALDVTIPRYWLPDFLNSFNSGQTISQAVFNASQSVYRKYPTPAAWACLHLYGNPNYRIDNK